MKEKKGFDPILFVIVISCLTACGLMIAPVFMEHKRNFFPYDIACLGFGIAVFVYSRITGRMAK